MHSLARSPFRLSLNSIKRNAVFVHPGSAALLTWFALRRLTCSATRSARGWFVQINVVAVIPAALDFSWSLELEVEAAAIYVHHVARASCYSPTPSHDMVISHFESLPAHWWLVSILARRQLSQKGFTTRFAK